MEVHERPCVLFDLPGIDKYFGEAEAVADVGGAAPPLPALVLAVESLLLLVTATVAQVALRAGGSDGVGHPCCDDGVCECSLFTAWGSRRKRGSITCSSGSFTVEFISAACGGYEGTIELIY